MFDSPLLSQQELNDLLHYFGLTLDWSALKLVPFEQIDQFSTQRPFSACWKVIDTGF